MHLLLLQQVVKLLDVDLEGYKRERRCVMKVFNSKEYVINISKRYEPQMKFYECQDFDTWKTTASKKLNQLLGLPFVLCEDRFRIVSIDENDEFKKIKFEFQSEENYFIECEMLCPREMNHPLPVAICLQGHSTGKHISLGYGKFEEDTPGYINKANIAVQAVRNGYCAVAFDQRYMGAAGQNEKGKPECIDANAFLPTLLLGRTPIGERVWDVQRLIDVLEKHFLEYVDINKIMCMGNSGGGTTTFYAAAVDERIHLAIPSCAVCSFDDSIIPIWHCGCNYIPGIRQYFDMGEIGCLIAPRKLIVVNGNQDQIFPLEGAKKVYSVISDAYKKLGKQDNCNMVVGNGGHRFYGDDVWPVINSMMK